MKRTGLPQRHSAKNPGLTKNTTEVKNQNSLPQIENREKTYAQAMTNFNTQNNVQGN
jgi:hypothetical protein